MRRNFPPSLSLFETIVPFFFFQLKKYCHNEALELELWEVPTWGGVVGTDTSPTPLLPIPLWAISLLWGQYLLKSENH